MLKEPLPDYSKEPQITAVILAGLSIDNEPMHPTQAHQLHEDCLKVLSTVPLTLFTQGQGQGLYNGVQEASLIFAGTCALSRLPTLRYWLSQLAKDYQQQSIGLITTDQPTEVYAAP